MEMCKTIGVQTGRAREKKGLDMGLVPFLATNSCAATITGLLSFFGTRLDQTESNDADGGGRIRPLASSVAQPQRKFPLAALALACDQIALTPAPWARSAVKPEGHRRGLHTFLPVDEKTRKATALPRLAYDTGDCFIPSHFLTFVLFPTSCRYEPRKRTPAVISGRPRACELN
jgi:hypothetical protein